MPVRLSASVECRGHGGAGGIRAISDAGYCASCTRRHPIRQPDILQSCRAHRHPFLAISPTTRCNCHRPGGEFTAAFTGPGTLPHTPRMTAGSTSRRRMAPATSPGMTLGPSSRSSATTQWTWPGAGGSRPAPARSDATRRLDWADRRLHGVERSNAWRHGRHQHRT